MSSFATFVSDHSFILKSAGSEKKSVLYDFIGTGKKSREDTISPQPEQMRTCRLHNYSLQQQCAQSDMQHVGGVVVKSKNYF